MTKIGTFYFFIFIALMFFFNQTPLYLFVLQFFAHLSLPIVFFLLKKNLQSQFQSEFVRFCSLLIIKMKMGYGFRPAYESILVESWWKHRPLLVDLLENVSFSPQKKTKGGGGFQGFLGQCQEVFCNIDKHPSSAVSQLEEFKNHLLITAKFRHRSRQIWSQIVTQLLFVSLIYWLLMIYIVIEFTFSRHFKVIICSLIFYFCGFVLLLRMRKVPDWKI